MCNQHVASVVKICNQSACRKPCGYQDRWGHMVKRICERTRVHTVVARFKKEKREARFWSHLAKRIHAEPWLLERAYSTGMRLVQASSREREPPRSCKSHSSGETYAVKAIDRLRRRELLATRGLQGAAGVVQLHDVCKDASQRLLLVMELGECDLLTFMLGRKQPCDDNLARQIFRGACAAVASVHAAGWMHLDVKLDNLILTKSEHSSKSCTAHWQGPAEAEIKLIDFEFAAWIGIGSAVKRSGREAVGTYGWSAPEVLHASKQSCCYGKEVDVWGLGVVLFALLTAREPFKGKSHRQTINNVLSANYAWRRVVDPDAKDLVRGMLTVDADKRMTLEDVAAHPWMTRQSS